MRLRSGGAGAVAACLLTVWAPLTACGPGGLDFRQDHRLAIVDPPDFSRATLPLTVHWRFSDQLGTAGGPAGFGVFVDAAPIGPGDSVDSLDRTARRALTVTTSTSLDVSSLDAGSASSSTRTQHDVTVVLLDASGHRMGETAARVSFYVGG